VLQLFPAVGENFVINMEWWNSSLILPLAFDISPKFLMMHISIAVKKTVLVIGMGYSNLSSDSIFLVDGMMTKHSQFVDV